MGVDFAVTKAHIRPILFCLSVLFSPTSTMVMVMDSYPPELQTSFLLNASFISHLGRVVSSWQQKGN